MSKNIVLLSDGTGNSSSKIFKTNVWRTFQTLDLTDASKQIAYYDNGVGTSSFKLFAVLGGVFGFGLKRNVTDIYSFCCRNYVAGDRIYGFGFSRGAFTIRVVALLIAYEGLVPYTGDEIALARHAEDAYRAFRRRFNNIMFFVALLRNLRDLCIKAWRHLWHIPQYNKGDQIDVPKIHFLGLWDTVDAYGGPIQEITDAIDHWYWPLSMPDRFMKAKVHRACHALALEDERDAFKPVIWDERYVRNIQDDQLYDMQAGWTPDVAEPEKLTPIDNRRLSQVWFVGVHSDVGGGYPQDGLSYVTLDWMFDRAEPYGLLFDSHELERMRSMADSYDKLNDSRHGLAGYYRYRPRNLHEIYTASPFNSYLRDYEYMIGELINRDPEKRIVQDEVKKQLGKNTDYIEQPSPIIHKAVFDRIEATLKPVPPPDFKVATDGYVPITLPKSYQVTDKAGSLSPANDPSDPEPPRYRLQSHTVRNLVWLRRIVYFLTVIASVALVAVPLIDNPTFGADTPLALLRPLIALAGAFLPTMASPWLTAYSAAPGYLVLGGIVVFALLYFGGWLQVKIRDVMRNIWIKPQGVTEGWFDAIAYPIRTFPLYRIFFYWLKRQGLPSFFAILMLFVIVAIGSQLAFRTADAFGKFCVGDADTRVLTDTVTFTTNTNNFCMSAQVKALRGEDYRITIEVKDAWMDKTIATNPRGFGFKKMYWRMYFGLPFRRVVFSNWFVPVLRIGSKGWEEHVLDLKPVKPGEEKLYEARFTPRSDGEVFLFVNDAVWGFPGIYARNYANNTGTALIKIEHLNISSRN